MKKCYRVEEERNVLQTIKTGRNCIDYILHRNCLIRYIVEARIEGRLEVTERRRRRCKQLLGNLNQREDTVN